MDGPQGIHLPGRDQLMSDNGDKTTRELVLDMLNRQVQVGEDVAVIKQKVLDVCDKVKKNCDDIEVLQKSKSDSDAQKRLIRYVGGLSVTGLTALSIFIAIIGTLRGWW
jgi:hypothetical protein